MAISTTKDLEKTQRAIEWLARAYWNVPEEEFLKSFNPSDFDICGETASEGLALMRSVVAALPDDLRVIAVDFTALFAGCRPGAPYPYESVFSGEGRLVMQGVRDSVLECYEEGGYAVVQGEGREPEDHISHELGYVASLYERAAAARTRGDGDAAGALLARARDFAARHPGRWIPAFCREVEDASETPFFKALARLTRCVVGSIR